MKGITATKIVKQIYQVLRGLGQVRSKKLFPDKIMDKIIGTKL